MSGKRPKKYKVRFPGEYYAYDFMAVDSEDALRQAREWYCGWTGKTRLPRGVEVWEFTPEDERIVKESLRYSSECNRRAGILEVG